MRRSSWIAVTAAAEAVSPRPGGAQGAPVLKLGVIPAGVAGCAFYAAEQGFFKNAGLEVDLQTGAGAHERERAGRRNRRTVDDGRRRRRRAGDLLRAQRDLADRDALRLDHDARLGREGLAPATIEKMHRSEFAEACEPATMAPTIDAAAKYGIIAKAFPVMEIVVTA